MQWTTVRYRKPRFTTTISFPPNRAEHALCKQTKPRYTANQDLPRRMFLSPKIGVLLYYYYNSSAVFNMVC